MEEEAKGEYRKHLHSVVMCASEAQGQTGEVVDVLS